MIYEYISRGDLNYKKYEWKRLSVNIWTYEKTRTKKNSTNEYHKNEQHKTTTNLQKQQRNTTPIHKSNNKDGFLQVSLAEYA